MGTVLGGAAENAPLPPPAAPRAPAPGESVPPAPRPAPAPLPDALEEWARERPHLGGPAPDQGAPPAQPSPLFGQPSGRDAARPSPDRAGRPGRPPEQGTQRSGQWGPELGAPAGQPGRPAPEAAVPDQPAAAQHRPPAQQGPHFGQPFGAAPEARFGRPEGNQFDRPAQNPQFGPPQNPQFGPTPSQRGGPDPAQRGGPPPGPRAASQQAGPRSRRGRPEDPRQAAVYDALAINEQVLDEVWTSPSVDVLKVVSSIVVNALDAYEDDPAEYADWVAVHRTGNCDCH
jgi:hypothetical protein